VDASEWLARLLEEDPYPHLVYPEAGAAARVISDVEANSLAEGFRELLHAVAAREAAREIEDLHPGSAFIRVMNLYGVFGFDAHASFGRWPLLSKASHARVDRSSRTRPSLRRRGGKAPANPAAVGLVKGSELVGDDASRLVHLLRRRGGVLVNE